MIKAIIFDMDGLMIDSERVTFECYQERLKDMNLTMDEEFYKTLLGKPIKGIYQRFYDVYGNDFPIENVIQDVHQLMAERFETEGVPVKKGLVSERKIAYNGNRNKRFLKRNIALKGKGKKDYETYPAHRNGRNHRLQNHRKRIGSADFFGGVARLCAGGKNLLHHRRNPDFKYRQHQYSAGALAADGKNRAGKLR